MSDKNQDYWKELMGEDFKTDFSLDDPAPKPDQSARTTPQKPAAPPETPRTDPGFTIEYIKSDGRAAGSGPAGPAQTPKPAGSPSTPPAPAPRSPEPKPASPAPTPGPAEPRPIKQGPATNRPAEPKPAEQGPVTRRPAEPKPAEQGPATRRPAEPRPATRSPSPAPRPVSPASGQAGRDAGQRRRDRGRDGFEMEFDFDAEYPDVDEKAVKRGRGRRTGCLSGILLFLFVISVSSVLAFIGWRWATDVLGLDGGDELVEVTLPKDIFHEETRTQEDDEGNETEVVVSVADVDAVAEELYQKGLIRYKWLFKLFSGFAHGDTKVRAGTYNLKMSYDYRALINGMNPRTGIRNTVKVTIPEGYTISQIVALMEENKVCDAEDLLDALANSEFDYSFLKETTLGDPKRLEGFLFPDTYEFYENDDPDSVIKRFLNNFNRKWTDELAQKARERGLSVRDILNIASMIEKEAGSDAERANIASVIYNRLSDTEGKHGTNTYLQIDATIRYAIADTGEDFSTEIDSPYNTYLYPGLPAGPIANPGLSSIKAALEPANTKYYYYALGKSGTHKFFETYSKFSDFVQSDQYGG